MLFKTNATISISDIKEGKVIGIKVSLLENNEEKDIRFIRHDDEVDSFNSAILRLIKSDDKNITTNTIQEPIDGRRRAVRGPKYALGWDDGYKAWIKRNDYDLIIRTLRKYGFRATSKIAYPRE